jgi:CelD/BcsL family acetyltransferase involved in cellulose biosynthesis
MFLACRIDLGVLDSVDRLHAFAPEWHRFLSRVPPTNPFQTPDWLLTWWSHFGSGEPRVLVFRDKGEITGVMPCFLHDWNGRRQLTLMGTGISDYLDPAVEPLHRASITHTLASYLSDRREWDVCDWQDLSADTPLAALGGVHPDTPCSELAIPTSFDAFLQSRPMNLQRNLRHCREKGGDVQFEVSRHADPELLTTLIDLHGARWHKSNQPGTIAANHAADFLRTATATLAARGMLRIFSLRRARRVVAILLALRNGTTLYSYITAYDPAYKKYGFGHELLARIFQYAATRGYRRWNFLRGEEPYKFEWGAEAIPKVRVVLQS